MTNYIKAELFRITNKKNILKYSILLFIGYLLLAIIRSSGLDIMTEGRMVFNMFTVFIGGIIFSVVYNDDLTNKTIAQPIGFGNKRKNIIFSKGIVLTITIMVIYIIGFVVFNIMFLAMGKNSFNDMMKLLSPFFYNMVLTIGYSLLAGTIAFSTQKPTFSIVSYVLLSIGMVKQIILFISGKEIIRDNFGDISRFTLSSAANNIFSDSPKPFYFVVVLAYLVLSILITSKIFNKKELEF